jgi:UDP-N-acetylmuramate: L-alanyl-gamma-D-glutamyl-meso-diaminopimelate ligase
VVDGITVIDDFANHPTAVRVTLEAMRQAYPGSRLWAVFEPRTSATCRAVLQQELIAALGVADRVVLADVYRKEQLPAAERLSPTAVVQALQQRHLPAWFYPTTEAMIGHICREAQSQDVILIMSSGGFENIHERLLQALAHRSQRAMTHGDEHVFPG